MWRLVALGFGWAAGLAALAVGTWLAVELGLLPALAMGLAVGLALRWGWARIRRVTRPPDPGGTGAEHAGRGGPGPAPAHGGARWGAAALGLGAVAFVVIAAAVAGVFSLTPGPSPVVSAPPPGIGAIYRASVEPGSERGSLVVRERYAVAVTDIGASPDLESPEAFRPEEGAIFVPAGWDGSLARDSVILTRDRTEAMEVSLWQRTSVVTLEVSRVSYDGPVLWARPGSSVQLDLPRHFLVATFPPAEPPVDLLDPRGLERTVLPITVGAGDTGELRLQVLHPALRHAVGENLTRASLLAPVKWAALALVAIFAEQIKARLLAPLARTVLETLRLPRLESGGGGGS